MVFYKACVSHDLKRYKYQLAALEIIPEKIKNLEEEYSVIRAKQIDNVDGGDSRRSEERLINNIDERMILERGLKIAKRDVELMQKALSCLDQRERFIIDQYYLEESSMEWIAKELNFKTSQVYNFKDKAEAKIATMNYGISEM